MNKLCAVLAALLPLALAGCGGFFDSKIAAPQAYVLRLPPSTPAAAPLAEGSLLVQRPEAGPGLESDRIALLRTDRRFDLYAAARWAAPAPDMVEAVVVDALRTARLFPAVFDDSSPYAPRYVLRMTLRRFEADYTAGGSAPTIHVALDCTLGRHRDRALLGSFTVQASAQASEDRMAAVVAAFEAATGAAVTELTRQAATALEDEPKR